ncbi:UspA domain protein [Pirellula staleyi DSM 6068]|uniref:UspA domain protein n=1 Tax=Pirellula staleyi (strain ATCC 27377 / DSM 6068 / ICPB 4128) TaxID=530564 RepID=D2QY55_PIRSD|nr:universal stress protein [Pirellula staleyi]ADB16269.1 UspA domain protein [Pirellula staleyi DSM 6068]
MNVRKILFPTDFSEQGSAALAFASSLARDSKATLVIVHVEEPPIAYGADMYFGLDSVDRSLLWRKLGEVLPTDPAIPCIHRLAIGDPAGAIVRVAEEDACDLIVMPTHGRSGFSRLLMGSVAEAVVRLAKCPVLTIKTPVTQTVKENAPASPPLTNPQPSTI